MRIALSLSSATCASSRVIPGSRARKNQYPPHATSPTIRPTPGTSRGTSRAGQRAGPISIVTAPSGASSTFTVPTGVSM